MRFQVFCFLRGAWVYNTSANSFRAAEMMALIFKNRWSRLGAVDVKVVDADTGKETLILSA